MVMSKLKQFFRTRYRIIRESSLWYEPQHRWWWMPFYIQIGFANSHLSVESAEEFIEYHRGNKVVKYL